MWPPEHMSMWKILSHPLTFISSHCTRGTLFLPHPIVLLTDGHWNTAMGFMDEPSSSRNNQYHEYFEILSHLCLDLLKQYTSTFSMVPHNVSQNKNKLIRWILDRAPGDLSKHVMSAALAWKRIREDHSTDRTQKKCVCVYEYSAVRYQEERNLKKVRCQMVFSDDTSVFLNIPTESKVVDLYWRFFEATSNSAPFYLTHKDLVLSSCPHTICKTLLNSACIQDSVQTSMRMSTAFFQHQWH